MNIKSYRDAVIEAIKAAMPEFREVEKHGGTFTEEQLKRYAMKAPACRVAFLGIKKNGTSSTGESKGPAMFAAYVIADDRKGAESFDVALDLSEKLAGVIHGNVYGTRAGAALVEGIENLFTLGSEKQGLTIAAVTFATELRFGVHTYLQDDPSPVGVGISSYDMAMLGIGGEAYTPGSER